MHRGIRRKSGKRWVVKLNLERKPIGEIESKWRNWIHGCISTSPYSILNNGSLKRFCSTSRGLRQGDPLSPFRFTLAMDSLSQVINKGVHKGSIKYFTIRTKRLQVSHLLYVDDTIIIIDDMRVGEEILKW